MNLYIPNERERKEWEKWAKKDRRSLSQFIRIAVHERIRELKRQYGVER